jgi:hypothetical protein
VDRLITLEQGDLRVPVDTSEAIDPFDFRLFNGAGDSLIHSEHRTFMTSIGLVLSPVGGQTTIEDDLSSTSPTRLDFGDFGERLHLLTVASENRL